MFYFGATGTPVLDFWWRLLWVSKLERVLHYSLLPEVNVMYIPRDPPPVLHLLTSWWPASQLVKTPIRQMRPPPSHDHVKRSQTLQKPTNHHKYCQAVRIKFSHRSLGFWLDSVFCNRLFYLIFYSKLFDTYNGWFFMHQTTQVLFFRFCAFMVNRFTIHGKRVFRKFACQIWQIYWFNYTKINHHNETIFFLWYMLHLDFVLIFACKNVS